MIAEFLVVSHQYLTSSRLYQCVGYRRCLLKYLTLFYETSEFPIFGTVCLFLNLDLKYSLRLSLNTDPTCRQRLRSYDRMAL